MVAANSYWHITNFRLGLVNALRTEGWNPLVLTPAPAGKDAVPALEGVRWLRINLDRWSLNPLRDLHLLLGYQRILRRCSPRLLLTYTIKPNIYGSMAAAMLGIPAIPNITGLGTVFANGGPLRRLVMAMYRFALRRCPVVFFQNGEDMQLFVTKRLVRADQARLLPGSGVDLDRFRPAPLPPGLPTLLLIARLLGDKGLRQYTEAAAILRTRGLDVKCQLLGPLDAGNPSMMSSEDIRAWVRDGIVDYLGETDDVRPFIAAASVIVLPTFYNEGVPRSLLEGAAMGRPLITTDIPGCRDVVQHGVNGFLCRARDSRDLADAMERMMQLSATERSTMGQAARAVAEQRFDERFVVGEYLQAIRQCVPRRVSSGARND